MATITFSPELLRAIRSVWNEIGSDVLACAAECEEEVDNAEAVETCIDADRLETGGFKKEAYELQNKIALYNYEAVMKDLCKVCSLV